MAKLSAQIKQYLQKIQLPKANSHKGQNGKLLIIGGSHLFHAASKWSLDVASKFVDMVFYSSVPENNQLIQEAKSKFWNGIVVPRNEVEAYLKEANCVLIGPGMERAQFKQTSQNQGQQQTDYHQPSKQEWNNNTQQVVNYLLSSYPQKRWVVDAGALQMLEPKLLNSNCIITPHQFELKKLINRLNLDTGFKLKPAQQLQPDQIQAISSQLNNCTILLKGPIDLIATGQQVVQIKGGNAGMTKGGTGDVLAGLVAALFATHDNLTSAVVASYINKTAGDLLYQKTGPYFNASDLVEVIPQALWQTLKQLPEFDPDAAQSD